MTYLNNSDICLKLASEAEEFEQIHQLNYRTFVDEIPQHPPNFEKRLVDKFHAENTYIIALRGKELVGMLAMRSQRPFSLDAKLPDIDSYLPPYQSIVECRLLSIVPEARKTSLFLSLIAYSIKYCLYHQHDLMVISGTTRQLKLYCRFGFQPFAFLVGSENALYQPMFLTLNNYQKVFSPNIALRKALQGIDYVPQ